MISLNRKEQSSNPRLSEELKSSRGKDGSTRLVQTALKSTLDAGTQDNNHNDNNKRQKNPRNESNGQSKELKRQRVVQIDQGRGKGFVTSHGRHGSNNFSTNNIITSGEGLNPQQILDLQAQKSGFANVEEMMNSYFQKNMLAMMQSMNPPGAYVPHPHHHPDMFPGGPGYNMPGMMMPPPHFSAPPVEGSYSYPYSAPPPYPHPHPAERGRGRFGRGFRGSSYR